MVYIIETLYSVGEIQTIAIILLLSIVLMCSVYYSKTTGYPRIVM